MVHNEIHTIDLLIIAAYLIAMVLIGLVVVRKVRNMDDYYLGGRSFGPLVLMATVCATIIGGSGLIHRLGLSCIIIHLQLMDLRHQIDWRKLPGRIIIYILVPLHITKSGKQLIATKHLKRAGVSCFRNLTLV